MAVGSIPDADQPSAFLHNFTHISTQIYSQLILHNFIYLLNFVILNFVKSTSHYLFPFVIFFT